MAAPVRSGHLVLLGVDRPERAGPEGALGSDVVARELAVDRWLIPQQAVEDVGEEHRIRPVRLAAAAKLLLYGAGIRLDLRQQLGFDVRQFASQSGHSCRLQDRKGRLQNLVLFDEQVPILEHLDLTFADRRPSTRQLLSSEAVASEKEHPSIIVERNREV